MFALVDCNSFYASCERVFRPDLKNKPIVVLSNNDGCVVALTKEAKEIGIKMCDPWFEIEKEYLLKFVDYLAMKLLINQILAPQL